MQSQALRATSAVFQASKINTLELARLATKHVTYFESQSEKCYELENLFMPNRNLPA